jgi:hypothetical protein
MAEELDRRTMALALAAVAEVETALGVQDATLLEAKRLAHEALSAGDRGEWLMADAQSEVAGWNRGRLGVLLRARAVAVAPATEQFLNSRREHEQVKLLVEAAQLAAQAEEDRRVQAAADDWFLSRRIRLARHTIVNRS